MMTQTQKRRLKWRAMALVTSTLLISQYQNCAGQSAVSSNNVESTSPSSGVAKVINGPSTNPNLFFVTASVQVSDQTTQLLTTGVCGPSSEALNWQLVEKSDSGLVVNQGSQPCSKGSFRFDLTNLLPQLVCGQSYTLTASNSDLGSDEMTISKSCGSVADNP